MYKKHWTVMLVIVCAMIALSGCQTGKSVLKTQNQGLQLSEAVLPTYMVGEYFNFDDGSSRMVAAVSGEWVTWQYNTGTVSKGYRNFIIPALTWTLICCGPLRLAKRGHTIFSKPSQNMMEPSRTNCPEVGAAPWKGQSGSAYLQEHLILM
jgi:hypothetical protein